MPNYTAAVFGRLQLIKDGRTAGVFTVEQDGTTYVILAELVTNKWRPFWSTATTNMDEDMINILKDLGQNMIAMFSGGDASVGVNDQVADIVDSL